MLLNSAKKKRDLTSKSWWAHGIGVYPMVLLADIQLSPLTIQPIMWSYQKRTLIIMLHLINCKKLCTPRCSNTIDRPTLSWWPHFVFWNFDMNIYHSFFILFINNTNARSTWMGGILFFSFLVSFGMRFTLFTQNTRQKKYKNPSQEFPQNLKKTYYTFSVNLGIWQFRVVFLHCVYQKNILKAATKKKKT